MVFPSLRLASISKVSGGIETTPRRSVKLERIMSTINSNQFEEICNKVWNERVVVLRGRGHVSGETALMRAVFWRLCKAGVRTTGCAESGGSEPTILAYQTVVGRMLERSARPTFDGVPILKELLERYQKEAGAGQEENESEPDKRLRTLQPAVSVRTQRFP